MPKTMSAAHVREMLLSRDEIAILDVREEDPFAQEHPLWAANLPLSRLELDVLVRVPRLDAPVVVYGEHDGHDLAPLARQRLENLGYTQVFELDGGLPGWRASGAEVFRDVNAPSKAFGELVAELKQTPSRSAGDVERSLGSESPQHPVPVVMDVRRYDEYRTMNIPTSISVPGGELVLRARELAPDPRTPIVVNCAGRTRSIIGAQSLINAGVPNPVVALRNGTIGWTLAGQTLDHGATRQAPRTVSHEHHTVARERATDLAARAGVRRVAVSDVADLRGATRTVYLLDVRSEDEYLAGHLPDFRHSPGGQLVQETDHVAPVRGARLVLADDDGVRAAMTASWLAQMGWETYVVDVGPGDVTLDTGRSPLPRPPAPSVDEASPDEVATWIDDPGTLIVDVGPSRDYVGAHLPGSWFAIRAQLGPALAAGEHAVRVVITSPTGELARWAAADVRDGIDADVRVLSGGTAAWCEEGRPVTADDARFLTPPTDRYRRPYEGTDNPHEAMQAYLDWEYGLVEQLHRDGTHFFTVV